MQAVQVTMSWLRSRSSSTEPTPSGGETFDTVVFTAWLHHVPRARLDPFWRKVESLLAPGGRVIFDFPDANIVPPGSTDIPARPVHEYGCYAPVDGISLRDHFGRRWRVIHDLWKPDELSDRLTELGWTMNILGTGLFGNVLWAEARRAALGRR